MRGRAKSLGAGAIALALSVCASPAVMERGGYPWNVELRSFLDRKGPENDGEKVPWLLNLGPTGIRARIYKDNPDELVVKYVFEDDQCPARGKLSIGDVIVGANGKTFKTSHRFGRRLKGGGGWDGPMMELAHHIEDSQGDDGVLELMVEPADGGRRTVVGIQLDPVGRFAATFPYNCPRSEAMLEALCDFLVADYESGNWKKANSFYGGAHGQAHQLLALMASGMSKYEPLIERSLRGYYGKRYDEKNGGFRMWKWGFDGIVMGEAYHLYNDKKLRSAMESLAAAMARGSHNRNGIYTHRSYVNIRRIGKKPYAAIAAISGLQMIGMSLFKAAGLPYDEDLYERIHRHYLNSTGPDAVNIAYAFRASAPTREHAVIVLDAPSRCLSGKGPGYVCPDGMADIGPYTITWPTKSDHRWKPTDWVADEADRNLVTELQGNARIVHRVDPDYAPPEEPARPYDTKKSGGHLAPVGMGALAHLIGNNDPSWEYLGMHAANTCVLGPNNAFDGHAASNLHAFWSILGAARSNRPDALREYFDYMKTFLILSECHNGGLYLQPWGRDRPNCNTDTSYGPRILPTATGAILLSLPKRRLLITGAGAGKAPAPAGGGLRDRFDAAFASHDLSVEPEPPVRAARTIAPAKLARLDAALQNILLELCQNEVLEPVAMSLSFTEAKGTLVSADEGGDLTFTAADGGDEATIAWRQLSGPDKVNLAILVTMLRPESTDARALAGVYLEAAGKVKKADEYFEKAGEVSTEKLTVFFE